MIKSKKYHIEDHQVIKGCISNKRKYQKFVYEELYSPMFYVVSRYFKNEDEVKDVLQDAFLKVFDKVHQFSFNGSFQGWVRKLIVFHCIDVIRKNKKENLVFNEEFIDVEDDVDFEQGYSYQDIMIAINSLSTQYKMVFSMYALDGFSHKEIAKELGVSEGTSKSNYSKAKKNIQQMLIKMTKNE